ncbi:MAG: hypothetical protein U5L02_18710 [Rheinheimera sp.]|nr:hypothetical protein [Rheinheimera sp.]
MKAFYLSILAACSLHLSAADLNLSGRSAADIKRDTTSFPAATLALLPLKPGQTVLDLFGGDGYYSELAAQLVGPNGKVMLHNNQAYLKYVGEALPERLKGGRLANVVRYDREADQLELKPQSLEVVLFVMGYHDFYHKSAGWEVSRDVVLNQLKAALKPGGALLVVDHQAQAGSGHSAAQDLHRIEQQLVIDELSKAGFVLQKQSDVLKNPQDDHQKPVFDPAIRGKTDRFTLVFTKP